MKPSEPRRNKNRNTTGQSTNGTSSGHVTGRKRKSPSPAPAAVVPDLNNPDGPLPEFACKVCGRLVAVNLFSIHAPFPSGVLQSAFRRGFTSKNEQNEISPDK